MTPDFLKDIPAQESHKTGEGEIIMTTLDDLLEWARLSSLGALFGLLVALDRFWSRIA